MTPAVVLAVQDRITSCIPVPDRVTVGALPVALTAILSVAVRVPPAEGVNITATVQWAPAATELPQVSVSAKSLVLVPVKARLRLTVLVPVLVRVVV
jgi:hypothetical protein